MRVIVQPRARALPAADPGLIWPGAIAAAIVAAWMLAYWLEGSGVAHVLHHHTIFHSGQIVVGGLALLGAWQVMTAAMMLPGALPAIRHFATEGAQLRFLGTYFGAWTVFALVAFLADMGLHALVHSWPVAARHENLIAPALLGVAAAYQLTPWKRASLDRCREPVDGLQYSLSCVASGWALMLIMFSAGVASIVWMAVLAAVMLAEKAMPFPDRVRVAVALALALAATATLAG